MERIVDISNCDGSLWAEDEGYLSDFTTNNNYLLSIAIDGRNVRIFYKDYKKTINNFKGKYYITLPKSYDGELHITNDYNYHIDWNIENGGYFGDFVRRDYEDTIILDMSLLTVICQNKEHHIEAVIKESRQEAYWQAEHNNSFSQPY